MILPAGPASFGGLIVGGHGRGRGLGFPTANIYVIGDSGVPVDGVYSCIVALASRDSTFGATTSIGRNPTFSDVQERRIEAYIHDLSDDIYGERIDVWVIERLREMDRFDSVDELVRQTGRDIERSRVRLREV
ncbi:riboflavin kinase [Saxibacter everestensis]|uniref:riboflavin kinase n=1 Tax=Saxibacter everestensis TaxID=2909229 RepID=A0ABY8QWB6_9MICO|nr:riboflavin kinase [Brevibacteriaceae bacterium ZFBP1038]